MVSSHLTSHFYTPLVHFREKRESSALLEACSVVNLPAVGKGVRIECASLGKTELTMGHGLLKAPFFQLVCCWGG